MKRAIRSLIQKMRVMRNQSELLRRCGLYPPGHYYSPIPSEEDVLACVNSRKSPASTPHGIDLNEAGQLGLLNEYIGFYHEQPFPEDQAAGCRYYFENEWFSYSDALFLYSFLRKHQPRRIIEVGSGFSSAVMLDTFDRFFPEKPDVTFIEPYPERLLGLLRNEDRNHIRLIDRKIQDVSPDVFQSLQPGDFLFIDSSHVMKCGSDLQVLMFEILPRLQPGVFVHFHDIFYPFEYPADWLVAGKYWNENYFLRAFLSWNSEWKIVFFGTYAHLQFGNLIKEKMPLCARNPGGSLYIQRKPAS